MDSSIFPNGIAVSPDDTTLAVGDFRASRMWYAGFEIGPNMGCPQCPRDPLHLTFAGVKTGTYIPGNGGPDGVHYLTSGCRPLAIIQGRTAATAIPRSGIAGDFRPYFASN
jgi:hypothetical protein